MKLNLEIELDWLDEEQQIDEQMKLRIEDKIVSAIMTEYCKDTAKNIAESAKSLVKAKTELVINSALENEITISEGWEKSTTYESVYDMIETEMTNLYRGKLNKNGQCKEDPILSNMKTYINTSIAKMKKDFEVKCTRAADNAMKENNVIAAISEALGKR